MGRVEGVGVTKVPAGKRESFEPLWGRSKSFDMSVSQVTTDLSFHLHAIISIAVLDLVSLLARYIYVDKVQSTFWNGPAMFVGLLAILSYLGRVQLISSRGLVQDYGLQVSLSLSPYVTSTVIFSNRSFEP